MISESINFSTGPVGILPDVMTALVEPPVSHRDSTFVDFSAQSSALFCNTFNVKNTYFLTGSGTLANEVMIQQIGNLKSKGLVLINGEFGRRLAEQAHRVGLSFDEFSIPWGKVFDTSKIENLLSENKVNWMLFCHCETSTGVVNPLNLLADIGAKHNVNCYVDCMSSMGTMPIDLSGIKLATASSGKGQGSIAGIALVFSNIHPVPNDTIPRYLDLGVYEQKHGVPFTISSNLLKALGTGAKNNLTQRHWAKLDNFSAQIAELLNKKGIIPYYNKGSRVFTIEPKEQKTIEIEDKLLAKGLILSCRSEYLLSRNWIQLALFGHYSAEQIEYALDVLNEVFEKKRISRQQVLKLTHIDH